MPSRRLNAILQHHDTRQKPGLEQQRSARHCEGRENPNILRSTNSCVTSLIRRPRVRPQKL